MYKKTDETRMIQELENWFLTEPKLKPIFRLLKDAVFTPESEFNLFIDSEQPTGIGTDSHLYNWDAFDLVIWEPEDEERIDFSLEDALRINKQNLTARLIQKMHYNLTYVLKLEHETI